MKIYKSIYDLEYLTCKEEEFAHANTGIWDKRYMKELDASKFRRSILQTVLPKFIYIYMDNRLWNKIIKKIKAPITKEDYFIATTQIERYNHLFYIFIMRGNFLLARAYELLLGKNFIRDFENIPRDLFINNELEYYEWRKKNL